MAESPLWTPDPSSLSALPITAFAAEAERRAGKPLQDYDALHAWSVTDPGAFWDLMWDFCGVIGEKGGEKGARRMHEGGSMRETRFFPDARLSFAENLLRETGSGTALVFRGEDKVERRLSFDALNALVSRLQQAMRAAGVGVGDRVAAMLPNMPETIAVMLAANSLGATFSSCSPDFGERGVLDRFGQIEPSLFFACDGYWYNGKEIEVAAKLAGDRRGAADRQENDRHPLSRPRRGGGIGAAARRDAGAFPPALRAAAAQLRAPPLRPPALHSLLVWHDRRAEMHRARRRRHAAAASQGAPAPLLAQAGRKALLLHHLRLDDVELARDGARQQRHPAPLRRLALLSRTATRSSTTPRPRR